MQAGAANELHRQLAVYHELERAVQELSSRGLHSAARWAAEQLNGLDAAVQQAADAALAAGRAPPMEPDTQDRHPYYMLARQHFEFKVWQVCNRHMLIGSTFEQGLGSYMATFCVWSYLQEYQRAARVLSGVPGPKALFLRCYSRYLAAERTRE